MVLTIGASLIATFGLVANSAAVVIGAMVVAPWILPLQAIAFGILQGRFPLVLRALSTLLLGVALTVVLSVGIGRVLGFPTYGTEVLNRTTPNLLDLAIALVAGAMAIYAKVRRDAISSLAGLAIAVALVPPVCSMGLVLASGDTSRALGAGLLFVTNLLGILSGALVALALLEPSFRQALLRSRLGLTSFALTALLLVPLTGSLVACCARPGSRPACAPWSRRLPRACATARSPWGAIPSWWGEHRLGRESSADPCLRAGHRSQPAHPGPGGGGAGVHQQPAADPLPAAGAALRHRGGGSGGQAQS